jgi:hypothetical protein
MRRALGGGEREHDRRALQDGNHLHQLHLPGVDDEIPSLSLAKERRREARQG